jgi:alanine racemase
MPTAIPNLSRPLWAEIDLGAIRANIAALRAQTGDRTGILAVVKANAYGHGAVPVARAALAAGARGLAVISVDEGVQLRRAGLPGPILVMSYIDPADAARLVDYGLTPTIGSLELARALNDLALARGIAYPVQVKVDTGLHRFGVNYREAPAFIAAVQALPGLRLEGLYTHFASAEAPDGRTTAEQVARFRALLEQFPTVPLRHAANSAGLLSRPDLPFDLARCGLAMYGIYPAEHLRGRVCLRPALALKARVIRVHALSPGDAVSYGGTWVADRPARIAILPCGYGDGWSRAWSNRGGVLIRGRFAPIRGVICMDHFAVDVTEIPGVMPGDEAVLIGSQGAASRSAETLAAELGVIPYELVTALSARVTRIYVDGGRVEMVETLVDP